MSTSTTAQTLDTQTLERILDVTRQLGRTVDLDSMLSMVIDAARDVLYADRGTVFLHDRENSELYIKVAHGVQQIRFPATAGIAGQCATTRQVINVPDCYADPRFNQEIDRKTGYRTLCMLTVPLVGVDEELVGVLQLLNKKDGVFDRRDEEIATALAAQCAVALQRATLLEAFAEKQKLDRDLELAREIQQGVLPKSMPKVPGYDLSGWNRPADQTGGDIYDAAPLDDGKVMLMMGDATGHGVGPAISVTQARAMVRMATRLKASLDDMFSQVNDQLNADLADNRFVTAIIGLLDANEHRFDYHSGGQGPLLNFVAESREIKQLSASTVPMGIMAGLPLTPPDPIRFGAGDIFALISDGIFEAMNAEDEQFGEDRVCEVIRRCANGMMDDLARELVDAVERFVGDVPQGDDMTIVLVKRANEEG